MYSVKNLLTREPTAITAFLLATLNILKLTGVLHMSGDEIAGINTVALLGLNLIYVRPLTASKSAIKELSAASVKKKRTG